MAEPEMTSTETSASTQPQEQPTGQPMYAPQPGQQMVPQGQPMYAPQPGQQMAPQGQPMYAPQPEQQMVPQGQPMYAPQPGQQMAPQGQPMYAPQPGQQPMYAPQPGQQMVPQGQPMYAPQPGQQPMYAPQPEQQMAPQGQPMYAPQQPMQGAQQGQQANLITEQPTPHVQGIQADGSFLACVRKSNATGDLIRQLGGSCTGCFSHPPGAPDEKCDWLGFCIGLHTCAGCSAGSTEFFTYPANTTGLEGFDVPACCIGCLASLCYPAFVFWEYEKRKQLEIKLNGGPVTEQCPPVDCLLVCCCPWCMACQAQRAMQSYRSLLKTAQDEIANPDEIADPEAPHYEPPDATGAFKED